MKRGRPITLSDDDLLAVAETVFLERGLDATTSEVARRAKISESVIFHRYKTKEALFLAVLEKQIELSPELEGLSALAGEGDVAENLHTMGMMLIERASAVLPFFMLAFSSPMKMTVLHEHARRAHPTHVRLLREYFEAEMRRGRLRQVDADVLAHTFFGGIREYAFMQVFATEGEPTSPDVTEYLRGVIDALLRGVAGEGCRK